MARFNKMPPLDRNDPELLPATQLAWKISGARTGAMGLAFVGLVSTCSRNRVFWF